MPSEVESLRLALEDRLADFNPGRPPTPQVVCLSPEQARIALALALAHTKAQP